jgi:hypothetical protein
LKFITISFFILFAGLVAQAQTPPTVGFTMNPSVFQQGQSATTMICMLPLPAAGPLTFDQNDVVGLQFDSSIGVVESTYVPLSVHSSTLDPADFQPHINSVNHNKLSFTYANQVSKQFAYTDTVCLKVIFTTSITAGSGVVRYSSKFTGIAGVVGELPYLTATIVDFPAGVPGPQGIPGIQGPKGDP